jgi:Flp pilus assembly protein TadB
MYEFVKTFQTVIVGVVGFVGVILTMLWNAHLQREQEKRRERREARALRTALIEELKQQREALKDTADSLTEAQASQDETQGSNIPLERFDAVFRRSLERLGLLERREVSAVFEAYLPLPRLTWRLRILEQIDQRGR